MARGAQKQATQNFNNSQDQLHASQGVANTAGGDAGDLYNHLYKNYTDMYSNPTGFDPATKAAMNTAGGQAIGGAISGAVGQEGLLANRTGNVGAAAPVLDESVRNGMKQNSENALNTELADAKLREGHKMAGLAGLSDLHTSAVNEQLRAMGLGNQAIGVGNQAVDANVAAGNSGWLQNITGVISALGDAAKGASGLPGIRPCWIAEAIWGENDDRTHLVRAYLTGEFSQRPIGRAVMAFYRRFGQQIAAQVRRHSILKGAITPLFDYALYAARKHFRDEARLMLKRVKTFEHWAETAGEKNLAEVSNVWGSPEPFYGWFVSGIGRIAGLKSLN